MSEDRLVGHVAVDSAQLMVVDPSYVLAGESGDYATPYGQMCRMIHTSGSGGDGTQRGGLGQTVEFSVDTALNWELNAVTSRLSEPPQGIFGGRPRASGSFSVNGKAVTTQSRIALGPDDVVCLELPGGGGYGEA